MIEEVNNLIDKPFKICCHILNYNNLLTYSINNAPQRNLFKFLIRSKPIWEYYNKNAWMGYFENIENEISLLNLTIFFGRYLNIDLIETLEKEDCIDEGHIKFAKNYLSKSKSILYFDNTRSDDESKFYRREKMFKKVNANLLKEGFVDLENISPPEVINI